MGPELKGETFPGPGGRAISDPYGAVAPQLAVAPPQAAAATAMTGAPQPRRGLQAVDADGMGPVWLMPRLQMAEQVVITRDMAQTIMDCLQRMTVALTMAEHTAEGAAAAYRMERARVSDMEQRVRAALFNGLRGEN